MFHLKWPQWKVYTYIIVSIIGLAISSYLLVHYVNGTPVACGQGTGCDVVRLSEYSWIFGVIPRPLTGIVYYVGMILLLMARLYGNEKIQSYSDKLIILGVIVGVIESVYLFGIQLYVIKALCKWCIGSGVATVALAGLVAWPAKKQA